MKIIELFCPRKDPSNLDTRVLLAAHSRSSWLHYGTCIRLDTLLPYEGGKLFSMDGHLIAPLSADMIDLEPPGNEDAVNTMFT